MRRTPKSRNPNTMRVVGRRKQQRIALSASARLLKIGARFNEEFQKLPTGQLTGIPKGLRYFRKHADANLHEEECLAFRMAQISKAGNGRI